MTEQGSSNRATVLTGAQALIRALEELGVDTVFGIPGGAILPVYDPMFDSKKLNHILVRHEQGAGHAATGYAQATGKVGVCMATSGPGATNLVTPIADAYMDSVPIVAITGQVATNLIGTDGFQEADICGITMPITKHNFLVTKAEDIPRALAEAFHIAATGRPGPVLVDVAKDAMQASAPFHWPVELNLPGYRPVSKPHGKQIREAARLITQAKRPVLYVGGGVLKARATEELLTLAELTDAPVVTTLMARGAFPDGHRQHLGMPGMHGSVAAVTALQKSDLIIALGAALRRPRHRQALVLRPRRQGGARGHRPGRDLQEPDGRRADRRGLPRGADRAGRGGARRAGRRPHRRLHRLVGVAGRLAHPLPARLRDGAGTNWPRSTSSSGSASSPAPTRSSPPAWASTRCGPPSSSPTTSRTRSSTPAAPAPWATACRPRWAPRPAGPDATVWAIDGDGCFQMTNQELATCALNNIPIKIAVINNGALGMVRQWQTLFYNQRYSNTDLQSRRIPDFVKLAEAYGCVGLRCETPEQVDSVIEKAMAIDDAPVVIDFVVHEDAMVWPMVPAGLSNDMILAARDLRPDFDESE